MVGGVERRQLTVVKLVQLANACHPMLATEAGIVTLVMPVPVNVNSLIADNEVGRLKLLKEEQYSNAQLPMLVTVLGIIIRDILQLENALFPIV